MVQIIEAPHYVRQPAFLFWIRIAILVLSVLVLGLIAFSLSVWTVVVDAFAFGIFCCIYNFIVGGYLIVSVARFVNFWNCWAVLALDIIGVVFWLAAWASMASWASSKKFLGGARSGLFSSFIMRRSDHPYNKHKGSWQAAAAASGLGALIW